MDEFDLLCNFDDFYLSIKDIIIDEILKYHDIEEQERIKEKFNKALILFYDEDKEKTTYLNGLIDDKDVKLIKKLFDKFNIKYNDDNFKSKRNDLYMFSIIISLPFDVIFDSGYKLRNHLTEKIVKDLYLELGFKLEDNEDVLTKIRTDKKLFSYFKAMDDYRLTLVDEFNNYKNYIYTRYNRFYRNQESLAKREEETSINLYREFIKFLLDNALVNNKDKEKLEEIGIDDIKSYSDLFCLDLFENKVYSDFSFKVGGIDFLKENKYDKNLEKTKKYLFDDCGISKDNLDEKIDMVLDCRESLRNKYLIATLGELPEIKKILKNVYDFMNQKNFMIEPDLSSNAYLLKNLILDDSEKLYGSNHVKNKVGCWSNDVIKILKVAPLDSFNLDSNYIEILIHEMIHISDNRFKGLGILDEILVEKLAWKIYNSIIERILPKYPYLKLDTLKNIPAYNKLSSLVDDFIDENFDILLKGKESGSMEYFYEKFGKDNFDAFTNYINEKYDLMCQYNLSSEQLLEQKGNIDEIKDNMRKYVTNNNHKHK